jgi:hypothetical protein
MKIKHTFILPLLAAVLALASTTTASAQEFQYSARSFKATYSFRLVPATSFAPLSATSGVETAPRQDFLRVGAFVADGAGGVRGRMVATTDDSAGNTVVRDFKFTGTYTLDVDGFGTLTLTPEAGTVDEGVETYALKLNNRGKIVHLIQTDNDGGGAKIFLTGDAVIDRPIGMKEL